MLARGDKIGIVCCSNGQKREYAGKLQSLEEVLVSMDLQPVFGGCIYEKEGVFSGTARERAQALMDFYMDDGPECDLCKNGKSVCFVSDPESYL